MKHFENIFVNSALVILLMGMAFFASCSDENDSSKLPVIESVGVTDPAHADSTFTQATPGSMIVIQGRNLGGATAVYINDQKINFNPNMNTDHSIIVSIPSEVKGFVLTAWNPELTPEIRVVTPGGVATYAFKVLAPKPSITRVDVAYPLTAGDEITIYGTNFLDITHVYFSDVNPNEDKGEIKIDVEDFNLKHNRQLNETGTSYITESELKFRLPELPFKKGYIVIETQQGTATFAFAALPPLPILTGISSDMPIPGSRVTIKGSNFIDVRGIMVGDAIVVDGNEVEVAEDKSSLSFIMPEKPTESTTISVLTGSGESNQLPFYRYETLLTDMETMGRIWYAGGDQNTSLKDANQAPYVADGKYSVITDSKTEPGDWAGPSVAWKYSDNSNEAFPLPGYDIIPANTPAEDVYLLFECFTAYPINMNMQYLIRPKGESGSNNDLVWLNYDKNVVGDVKQIQPEFVGLLGDQPLNEWYTTGIPLSLLGNGKIETYSDLVEMGVQRVRLQLRDRAKLNVTGKTEVFVCIDNIRVSTLPTYKK